MSMGRYELRTISSFGQTIVAIYNTIEEAQEQKMWSQDLPVVIYDADKEQPIITASKGL